MKARILNICLAVLLIAAGYVWGNRSVVHASASISTIPKAWGHAVGATENLLILEDANGTDRFVNAYTGQILIQVDRK